MSNFKIENQNSCKVIFKFIMTKNEKESIRNPWKIIIYMCIYYRNFGLEFSRIFWMMAPHFHEGPKYIRKKCTIWKWWRNFFFLEKYFLTSRRKYSWHHLFAARRFFFLHTSTFATHRKKTCLLSASAYTSCYKRNSSCHKKSFFHNSPVERMAFSYYFSCLLIYIFAFS